MRVKKRTQIILGLTILCLAAGILGYRYEQQNKDSLAMETENQHEGIIRLHVIANSDSEEDQRVKLQVRNAILELLSEKMTEGIKTDGGEAVLDIETSRNYINQNIAAIEDTAKAVIKKNGYTYSADAELKVRWIPEKTYGEIRFPAGNYEALNVTLGRGEGENWWCVLFPPLCLIDVSKDQDERGEMEEKLGLKKGDGIIIKSKLLDLLK